MDDELSKEDQMSASEKEKSEPDTDCEKDADKESKSEKDDDKPDFMGYKVVHSHLPWPKDMSKCFVCQTDADTLLSCEMCVGDMDCPIKFHDKCIRKYNAAEFDYGFLSEMLKKRCCPLHHCSYCYEELLKSTSIYFEPDGQKLVTCDQCMQAFHECCIPAGPNYTMKELIKGKPDSKCRVLTCPGHMKLEKKHKGLVPKFAHPKEGPRKHVKYCSECEDLNDEKLLNCDKCIRSYHASCHRIAQTVVDGKKQKCRNLCESCILSEPVRQGTYAVALFGSRFFPCMTVDQSEYPKGHSDRFKSGMGKPGYVAIKWLGCNKLYQALPINLIMPMTKVSYEVYADSFKSHEKDIREAWKDAIHRCSIRKAIQPTDDFVEIKQSQYTKGCKRYYIRAEASEVECECKGNMKERCGAECTARDFYNECPESCEIDANGQRRPCYNRCISNGVVAPGLEVRASGKMGNGVFTTLTLDVGTFVAEYAGEIISPEEKLKRIRMTNKDFNNDNHDYMMDLTNQTIDCKRMGNIARFINHSCDPNCRTQVMRVVSGVVKKDKKLVYKMEERVGIYTTKKIAANEELTFDYLMERTDKTIPPKCFCGTSKCTRFMGKPPSSATKKEKVAKSANKRNPPVSAPSVPLKIKKQETLPLVKTEPPSETSNTDEKEATKENQENPGSKTLRSGRIYDRKKKAAAPLKDHVDTMEE